MDYRSRFALLPHGRSAGDLACVSQNSRELLGPEKLPVKLPKTLSGVSQSARNFRAREKSRNFTR